MVILGMVLLVVAIYGFIILCFIDRDSGQNVDTFQSAVMGMLITMSLIGGIIILDEECNPSITPMDVYQGKTILKYEVVDGVKVDSMVIWKEE